MDDKTDHTRRLNDLARVSPDSVNATWIITRGLAQHLAGDEAPGDPTVAHSAPERVAALRAALGSYSEWDPGNDPYHEHDFGAFELFGERLFFKIGYYHPDHDTHAPDPASIETCRRVLTIMLAEEY
jgi:hypothetical protein